MSEEKKEEVLDQEKALDMNELDAVAGGKKCYCAIGGGGEPDSVDKTCACVFAGSGITQNSALRCTCVAYGEGRTGD